MAPPRVPPGIPAAYKPLPPELTAQRLFSTAQARVLVLVLATYLAVTGLRTFASQGPSPMTHLRVLMCAITTLNTIILAYKFSLFLRGLGHRVLPLTEQEKEALSRTPRGGWPHVNVLLPVFLMNEQDPVRLINALVGHMQNLLYVPGLVHFLLVVEEKDTVADAVLEDMILPPAFEVVTRPAGEPGAKPGACNWGLLTRGRHEGSLTVIFDVEDRHEGDGVWQLRMAAHQFAESSPSVVCLQAQLEYHNPWTNVLTRLFSAEYAMHFAIMLPGLVKARAPIPLGGTSNYFRTEALLELGCWDPFNVTEDCDLGVRIKRRGWLVEMLRSKTLEEANARVPNFLNQQSRWKKGFIQTYLVHLRHPVRLWRELGTPAFWSFQLVVGGGTLSTLVNPALWCLTALYVTSRIEGWTKLTVGIESLFPGPIFYFGLAGLVLGNAAMVYFYLAGCAERRLYGAMFSTLLLLPAYWVLTFVACVRAVIELFFPVLRHGWAHTRHGLIDEETGRVHGRGWWSRVRQRQHRTPSNR